MKQYLSSFNFKIFSVFLLLFLIYNYSYSQLYQDSTYLPKILIHATNGFGPYVIGTKNNNMFYAVDLPTHTSKITFKFVDAHGVQFTNSYSEEGSYLNSASWFVELDTIDFPLSPQLNIEVKYQSDSTAIYNIPYTVYPDTINFYATAGWGPFVTNNYTLSDTSWIGLPEKLNSFAVSNLPPRTDTVELVILSNDSTAIDSFVVYNANGQYLDSASFTNVRMDSLPLSTKYLQAIMYCDGGPDKGVIFHKELQIIPQAPHLTCLTDGEILFDSIAPFVENQAFGQALRVDSSKYALIYNSPGETSPHLPSHQLKGPYSIDILNEEYTIESWLKFNKEAILSKNEGEMTYLKVDDVWQMAIVNEPDDNQVKLSFSTLEGGVWELFYGYVDYEDIESSEWHHIAFNCQGIDSTFHCNFYFDGEYVSNHVNLLNFIYLETSNYKEHLLTNAFYIGGCTAPTASKITDRSFISELDEIRIWKKHRSGEEIHKNYQRKVLQDTTLVGYWNFDDLRNHKKEVYDISYYNNSGMLNNGAVLVPQHNEILEMTDTLIVVPSYSLTDSVQIAFIDKNNGIIDKVMVMNQDKRAILIYDISSLSHTVDHLEICEFYTNCPEGGFKTNYRLQGLEQSPIATPLLNWQKYYTSPDYGNFFSSLLVSEFPEKTEKVILGLRDENELFDTIDYLHNCFPYHSSLALNGSDNYLKPSGSVTGLMSYTVMFWFKTTTKEGGPIVNFSNSPNGIGSDHTPEIFMNTNGNICFETEGFSSYYYLESAKKYNDGQWHHIAATVKIFDSMKLYVDGNLVDSKTITLLHDFTGYWVIGHGDQFKSKSISEYFEGSLTGISIWHDALNYEAINANRFQLLPNEHLAHYYKLNEGSGTSINDSQGNIDYILQGAGADWQTSEAISKIGWDANLCDLEAGTYTFFSKVFYEDGPDEGFEYPLGNFLIIDPLLGFNFQYNLSEGQGYFDEGVEVINQLSFETDFDQSTAPGWQKNFVGYKFYSPNINQTILSHAEYSYTASSASHEFSLDMGVAPPGSYILIQFGYYNESNSQVVTNTFSIPIYLEPLIPPKIIGKFGPFNQAIAPGAMVQENTFEVKTEAGLTDLKSIKARFYDKSNNELLEDSCSKINDTLWMLTYDMGLLSPPSTFLRFEYYLGDEPVPALVEGPYVITIQKTKPEWFDFLADTAFHDVQQTGDEVTFSLNTPFEDSYLINNSVDVKIPNWVPLLGGSSSKMKSPTAQIYLKYVIPEYKLELNQTPNFFQKVFNIGGGPAETLRFGFNYSQNNSYSIDTSNNILATQNFSSGGSLTTGFNKGENIAKKVKELIDIAEATDPESVIVKPTFGISFTGSFEYSSRLHLKIDPGTGKWGSYGNLDVDANPAHTEAFKNSSSFHFYSGSLGMEFSVGAQFLDGLVEGDFGLDGRFILGFGHSYTTIPKSETKLLKSLAFQTYGRFYITVLWGWYEKNIWGPKMFYNRTIWGNDMTNAFPPMKNKTALSLEYNGPNGYKEMENSLYKVDPVSWFNKIQLANPQQFINQEENNRIFTWLEPGTAFGERKLCARHFDANKGSFSDTFIITTNRFALNSPSITMVDTNIAVCAWAQTRHTPETIFDQNSGDIPRNFVQSQDIWFALYDINTNKLVKMDFVNDDTLTKSSGRAEANPVLTVLSESRVLLSWQAADLESHQADIWYAFLECENGTWEASTPSVLAEIDGVETELKIASPKENMAVAVWKNTQKTDEGYNRFLTTTFMNNSWSVPEEIAESDEGSFHNYLDVDFENGFGALTYTDYVVDTADGNFERLSILPWNPNENTWNNESSTELFADSVHHLQLPKIAINENGTTVIGYKIEKIGSFNENEKISQIDLFLGNITNPAVNWKHIQASELVSDTTKQVRGLDISFAGNDTIMLLSHEFIMSAADMQYEPMNGVRFGDPYMNLVLRSMIIDENGYVDDVKENLFFENQNDSIIHQPDMVLGQNYPNPCKAKTTIDFYIPKRTNVLFELFDFHGLLVETVINKELEPGHYEVSLDTGILGRGSYIYRLTTDNNAKSLKMSVVK